MDFSAFLEHAQIPIDGAARYFQLILMRFVSRDVYVARQDLPFFWALPSFSSLRK